MGDDEAFPQSQEGLVVAQIAFQKLDPRIGDLIILAGRTLQILQRIERTRLRQTIIHQTFGDAVEGAHQASHGVGAKADAQSRIVSRHDLDKHNLTFADQLVGRLGIRSPFLHRPIH
jgi:hypothetical protein